MALTKKQIKQLRAMANSLKPLFYVGKNDLTESAVNQADETIEKHELIKCAVQDGSGLTAKEAAAELAEQLNAEVVQSIGNRFVLFRRSRRDDVEHIRLVRDSGPPRWIPRIELSMGGGKLPFYNRHYSYAPSEHRH